jgi:phosphoglycolate phosphatase-like HAD superfamily hydrolase
MIKLVIFDFDDTIINNNTLDYQSFKNSSIFFKLYIPSVNEIKKFRKKGYLASTIFDWIQKKSKKKINKYKFLNFRKQFLESNSSIKYLKFQPGAKNTLKKLNSYGIFIVICSLRKRKSIIKKFLKSNDVYSYIDHIINYEKGTLDTRKPKLSIKIKKIMFKKIMKQYKRKPEETMSIGNSIADYLAAKECGFLHYNLFFNNNHLPKSKLEPQLSSFREIFDILNTNTENNIKKK